MFNSGEFSSMLKSGNFSKIHVGDYIVRNITIDGVTYSNHIDIIVDLNPYYGKANPSLSDSRITTNHVAIIPYNRLGKAEKMNTTDSTSTGFKNSSMHNTTLSKYLNAYRSAYGSDHIMQFGHLVTTSTDANGVASNWSWESTYITLMTEVQVFGSTVFSNARDVGEGCSQLFGFVICPPLQNYQNTPYWLRGIASSSEYSHASADGIANKDKAANSEYYWCRPLLMLI